MSRTPKEIPEKCPHCGSPMFAIEADGKNIFEYKGVIQYICFGGDYREGAFCGKELFDNEFEKPYCDGPVIHPRQQHIG